MASNSQIETDLDSISRRLQQKKDLFETKYSLFKELNGKWRRFVFIVVFLLSLSLMGATILAFFVVDLSASMETVAKSLIAPSITINGLCLTLFPVITFFFVNGTRHYMNDLEKLRERMMGKIHNAGADQKNLKIVEEYYAYEYAFANNVISDTFRYARKYELYSLVSLPSLIILFLVCSSNYAFFIIIDVAVISMLILGIMPILNLTFLEQVYKLKPAQPVEEAKARHGLL